MSFQYRAIALVATPAAVVILDFTPATEAEDTRAGRLVEALVMRGANLAARTLTAACIEAVAPMIAALVDTYMAAGFMM